MLLRLESVHRRYFRILVQGRAARMRKIIQTVHPHLHGRDRRISSRLRDGPFSLRAAVEPADESSILPDRHLRVSSFPVESEEETRLEFVDDFFPKDFTFTGFEERAQNFIQAAKLLGRPGSSYHESTFRGSPLLTERIFIHNEVRKRIKNDVEALFKLR